MLRISEIGGGNGHIRLKVEGRVVGAWVSELAAAADRVLETGRALKLDLADVSYVDREGVRLLLELKRKRTVLAGCSPFILEELREAERAAETPNANLQAPEKLQNPRSK